jgi:glycosyltransferase involved in cell wall biosynthesis
MKVLIFSMAPLFPEHSMGGSQKILRNISCHLGSLGHQVTILSTKRPNWTRKFKWHRNVTIFPTVPFKQPFPDPYRAPPLNIARAIEILMEHLKKSDVFYVHDGSLIFPYLYANIPTIFSLRDLIYSETLQGAFTFQGDHLILISNYEKECYLATVGRFFPDLKDRTSVIPNGVDTDHFKFKKPKKILKVVPLNPLKDLIILYPHRPEKGKGIEQVIKVIEILVKEHRLKNIKVPVPLWLDLKLSSELQNYYFKLKAKIAKKGLEKNFVFHKWISYSLMPEYYSLGLVTLCLGNYIETFGNVPFESLSCGIPVIVTKVGPFRTTLPDNLVDKIDYGDIKKTVKILLEIIKRREFIFKEKNERREFIKRHFGFQRMCQKYANIITNTKKWPPLRFKWAGLDYNVEKFQLAPWCYITGQRIYHDFKYKYLSDSKFTRLIETRKNRPFSIKSAATYGISPNEIMRKYQEGYLTIEE